ncbi:MAG: SpoIID/LytB domain-containing protein [Bacteroidales bacterium]|nr:SpoIID/LytB domain-containing protein [Bacteroidales bacterium]
MKYVLTIISLLLAFNFSKAETKLLIHIFSNSQIRDIDFEVFSGKYEVVDTSGKVLGILQKNEVLQIRSFGKLMLLTKNGDTLGIEEKVELRSAGFLNILELTPIRPAIHSRVYDDDMIIEIESNSSLKIINNVQLEHYVAGVIEAEAGIGNNEEFFKVQAVSTRTFALKNMNKHEEEGFHLCDQTHCQVYQGRCSRTDIMIATSKTAGQVMIDSEGELISAVFHSNSGGQTANSEDVWSKALPYLRSKIDSFSIGQRSYSWTQSMKKQEWLDYLNRTYNYPIDDLLEQKKVLSFSQPYRKVWLTNGISLKRIRQDLHLRSTFFNISTEGDIVTFTGRGFGHGVGMSQEGAIKMAKIGYSYDYILKFYYSGIEIIQLDELNIN